MAFIHRVILLCLVLKLAFITDTTRQRARRYLLTPINTQWGVFATISIPLQPESTTSVAWFFEVNFYTIANATYFEPILGDVGDIGTVVRNQRSIQENKKNILTRSQAYLFIESMLEKHGFPGRQCLLRAICESSAAHLLHNGVVGDMLHVVLTPSSSELEEDIEDCFYEAEYLGIEEDCSSYSEKCPSSPLDLISMHVGDMF